MRRVLATLATTALLLTAGCAKTYELRLDKTIETMRYNRMLDNNLTPPITKTKLESLNIYVRPPKDLAPSKEFLLSTLEPGKFDDAESLSDPKTQAQLHILSRVKTPKVPTKKGAPAPPQATRGEFIPDVVAVLNGVYNVEIDPARAKEESKKLNKFKHLTFEGNGKDVQVYFYGGKGQPYEVALILEYPKAEKAVMSRFEKCLECFAIGEKAKRAFSGTEGEEEAGAAGATSPVAF
jgi:hypothetical protein